MLKINSKGFVLVETLVVAVFVSAIFSVIYSNFYPIMGEYEKREAYDDIDSKYATFWFKRIIQSDSVNFTNIQNDITNNSYHEFNCSNDIVDSDVTAIKICNSLVTRFGVEKMYITNYKLGNRDVSSDKNNFKDIVEKNDPNVFSSGLQDYVAYLPTYSKVPSLNGACYRLVVEFHNTRDGNDYWTYSTIEILKGSRC
ncbi:MAG: hypothetical protein SOV80_00725 [Bacilli bacterium]|nr:hypothetical protein [bacterium]MDY2696730.1 hypothetical protein [Bacilli bacterium]